MQNKIIALTSFLLPVIITAFVSVSNRGSINILQVKQSDSANKVTTFLRDSDGTTSQNKIISALNFYYHDSLAYGHQVNIGKTETKLILNYPTLLFRADDKQTPFLIYPGEKINIKYAGSDSVQLYIKNNLQRTNELDFFRKLVLQTGNLYYAFTIMPYHQKVNDILNLQALEESIHQVKESRLQYLHLYNKQHPVSNEFFNSAQSIISSTALTDSLLLYANNKELLNKQSLYNKLIIAKLNTFKFINYTPYQIYYYTANKLVSLLTSATPNDPVNNQASFIKRFNFVNENFTGNAKDFLLSYCISSAYNNSINIPAAYLSKFNIVCKNKGYKKIIAAKLINSTKLLNATGENLLLSGNAKTIMSLKLLIDKNKGKLIFLDFWASWCVPCRQEMPYLKVLEKRYAGKKVVFFNISTDGSKEDWLKAKNEEDLDKEKTFLFLNSNKAQFIKQYNILSIPRYILIDKNGKVINSDAPRPSEDRLVKLLDKNL